MKKLSKKLTLNPKAIANLNNSEMFSIRGGNEDGSGTGGTRSKRCSNNCPTCCACAPCDPEETQ